LKSTETFDCVIEQLLGLLISAISAR